MSFCSSCRVPQISVTSPTASTKHLSCLIRWGFAFQHWSVQFQYREQIQRWNLLPQFAFFRGFCELLLSCTLFRRVGHCIPSGENTLSNVIRSLLALIDVAMARSLMYSVQLKFFGDFLFKNLATPCLLSSSFPTPMKMGPGCDSQISALLGLHVSENNRATHLQSLISWTNSSILSLEVSDLVFVCSTTKVTMFFIIRFRIWCCCLCAWLRSHFSLFFFIFLCCRFLHLLLCFVSTMERLRQWNWVFVCLRLFHWSVFLADLCRKMFFRDYSNRSHLLIPASDPHDSTAHNRRDEFFDNLSSV